jgi:hypothetical protein
VKNEKGRTADSCEYHKSDWQFYSISHNTRNMKVLYGGGLEGDYEMQIAQKRW